MEIYQHFRDEERSFVDQALEWQHYVKERYAYKTTDFLDPREQEIIKVVIGKDEDVKLSFWGGAVSSERKRALIYPAYYEPIESDYGLVLFQLHYPDKFVSIEHRDLLGALMGLGVKREKFGDILISGDDIQFVVAEEIADYVQWNLQSVGKASVLLEKRSFDYVLEHEEEWKEYSGTVTSLRLDVLLAEMYQLSRGKVLPYIQSGAVKVNWKKIEQPSYECQSGDHFSVRGLGRSQLITVDGKTKKDKWRIVYGRK